MTQNNEIAKSLYKLLEEIARREKMKAVEASDYGSAFMLAILEGVFKEAALAMPPL